MTRLQPHPPVSAPVHSDPEAWISHIFAAQAARGGVVRRSIAWVDREIGRDRFLAEVRRRGFHLLATSNQFIVVCNREPVQMLF
ncbi:N-(5'-phosphoribosyl)anthranilate isomerase [Rhodobacter sp. Har01]|uniref:N-(5'-phosphoribosyl)anthranilate isomerase n=1 Tax=Rhodobacter sp. Har01 TaxID=2883999 RepID=UPI001D084BDB|nr:N-(5'-phosphoribosyl)anthranilate isomerase [Rhodobacter sp. Har01]MCB6177196.1 N-(5'-phosphoribosyl)anthranilate isomerase [Rhodobacter sp. Har01]